MLFERFIRRERNQPPAIDVGFEHQRREEVPGRPTSPSSGRRGSDWPCIGPVRSVQGRVHRALPSTPRSDDLPLSFLEKKPDRDPCSDARQLKMSS